MTSRSTDRSVGRIDRTRHVDRRIDRSIDSVDASGAFTLGSPAPHHHCPTHERQRQRQCVQQRFCGRAGASTGPTTTASPGGAFFLCVLLGKKGSAYREEARMCVRVCLPLCVSHHSRRVARPPCLAFVNIQPTPSLKTPPPPPPPSNHSTTSRDVLRKAARKEFEQAREERVRGWGGFWESVYDGLWDWVAGFVCTLYPPRRGDEMELFVIQSIIDLTISLNIQTCV